MIAENRRDWRISCGTRCVVDTQIYLGQIQQMLEEGYEVSIPVSGTSMWPWLQPNRDYVRLCPVSGTELIPGMVVLFCRKNGAYVLHRIIRRKGTKLYLSGDAQSILEGPIEVSCVLGWVSHVARAGEWHRLWRKTGVVYGMLWRKAFPLRRWWFFLIRWCGWLNRTDNRRCEGI